MRLSHFIIPIIAVGGLTACSEAEEPADTSYEEQLPSPVPQGDTASEPAPDNTSIEGGPDEQVDQQYGGENTPVVDDPAG